jgi:coenzyme F420 hydrogenase subunit beta
MSTNHSETYQKRRAQDEAQIEQQFLKGTKDPDLGVYCDLFSAKTAIEGQDGGVVSALLAKGFEEGTFDAAIVVRRLEGYNAEAAVATNADEALQASGTKYLRVNTASKLRELVGQGKRRIAVVCTPCEAKNVRKIQRTLKDDCEITVIGLFCFEAFKAGKLKEQVQADLGVDLGKAEKTQIRQGKFAIEVEGKEYSCRVKALDGAVERACLFCDDFVSRLADVAVGSVGSRKGYSTVVVRSMAGENLVKSLCCVKESVDREEVAKLAKFKAERAKKSFNTLNTPK